MEMFIQSLNLVSHQIWHYAYVSLIKTLNITHIEHWWGSVG